MNKKVNRGVWRLPDYGLKVRYELAKRGMTVTELARIIGISRPHLSGILYGKVSSLKHIAAINKALGFEDEANSPDNKASGN